LTTPPQPSGRWDFKRRLATGCRGARGRATKHGHASMQKGGHGRTHTTQQRGCTKEKRVHMGKGRYLSQKWVCSTVISPPRSAEEVPGAECGLTRSRGASVVGDRAHTPPTRCHGRRESSKGDDSAHHADLSFLAERTWVVGVYFFLCHSTLNLVTWAARISVLDPCVCGVSYATSDIVVFVLWCLCVRVSEIAHPSDALRQYRHAHRGKADCTYSAVVVFSVCALSLVGGWMLGVGKAHNFATLAQIYVFLFHVCSLSCSSGLLARMSVLFVHRGLMST
jgi:hypothetical protein